ncbi:PAS domain S-box protein [Deinococcus sp. UYEF24]
MTSLPPNARSAGDPEPRGSGYEAAILRGTLPQIVVSTNSSGQTSVNRSGLVYTGLAAPYPDWTDVIHPDDQGAEVQAQRQATAGQAAGDLSVRLRASDGVYHSFLGHHESMLDAQGGFGGWVTTYSGDAAVLPAEGDAVDLPRLAAEREQLLLELALERARFEAILAQMPQGVLVADVDSRRISLVNTQMERILGGPLVPGVPLSVLEVPSFRPDGQPVNASEMPLARALRGETIHGEEFEIERKDGSRAVVQESAAPIMDRTGQVVAAVLTIDDLSEKRRVEAEVRRLRSLAANAQEALQLYGGGPVTPERFTELVGELYSQLGQPQLEGRLVALLLLEAQPISLGDAAQRLGVSKVAVSKVSNVMLEHGDLQISKSFSSREHLLALTDHTYIRDLSVRRVASWAISVLCDQVLAGGDVEQGAVSNIREHLEMHARTAEVLGQLLSPVEQQQARALSTHQRDNWDAVSPKSESKKPNEP